MRVRSEVPSFLAILCVLSAVGFVVYAFTASTDDSVHVATVGCAAFSALAVAVGVWASRKSDASANPASAVDLRAQVDSFATAIFTELTAEYELHRVPNPVPLKIGFQRCDEAMLDSTLNVYGASVFPALLDTDVLGEVFSRIPKRRLVVLGPTGSGKTTLAIALARDMLSNRLSGRAVPVLLNVATWRSRRKQSFPQWLTEQLSAKYPALQEQVSPGRTLATALLDSQLILPILDGFDGLAPNLYSRTLAGLNKSSQMPLILISRTHEYEAAIDGSRVLSLADGVVLDDLCFAEVEQYLPRTTNRRRQDGNNIWYAALERMKNDPSAAPVRDAFMSPLTVFLGRARYSADSGDHDPLELLDTQRFPTAAAVNGLLLESYIPDIYGGDDSEWHPDAVQSWLSRIARGLEAKKATEFGWWDLRDSLSRPERMILFAVVGALGGTLLLCLFSPWFGAGMGAGLGLGVSVNNIGPRPSLVVPHSIRLSLAALNLVAVIIGAEVATVVALMFLPIQGWANRDAILQFVHNPLQAIVVGFGLGGLLGLVDSGRKSREVSVAQSVSASRSQLSRAAGILGLALVTTGLGAIAFGALHGFVFGMAAGAGAGIVDSLEETPDVKQVPSLIISLRADRVNTLVKLGSFGALVGVLFGIFYAPAGWLVWLTLGVSAGVANGAGVALGMNAWGHWLVVVRFWLAATRRCPSDVVHFLEDARTKGVLRQVGGVHQFRHKMLQESLARAHGRRPRVEGPL